MTNQELSKENLPSIEAQLEWVKEKVDFYATLRNRSEHGDFKLIMYKAIYQSLIAANLNTSNV